MAAQTTIFIKRFCFVSHSGETISEQKANTTKIHHAKSKRQRERCNKPFSVIVILVSPMVSPGYLDLFIRQIWMAMPSHEHALADTHTRQARPARKHSRARESAHLRSATGINGSNRAPTDSSAQKSPAKQWRNRCCSRLMCVIIL